MNANSVQGERDRVLALLQRFGWNATSFQILESGFSYWFDDDAVVGFVQRGKARVVAGAPIAAPERTALVTRRFLEASRAGGFRVTFFPVEHRLLRQVPMKHVKLGVQPWWNPERWERSLAAHRSLREQLRRARAKGVDVRPIDARRVTADPVIRRDIERLVTRWSAQKAMPPMTFLVDVEPFEFAEERRYWGAWRDGEMIAVAIAVPIYTRDGWFLEDLLREPSAPNGTTELLIDSILRDLAREGVPFVTMGMAPLAEAGEPFATIRRLGAPFYNFDGVLAFKRKFHPDGEDDLFAAWEGNRSALIPIIDSLRAFARGGMLRFGLGTITRGPAPVVQLLGWLLIPWTAAIAHPASARFFPSRAIRVFWVVWDLLLVVPLIMLGRRWNPLLARVVLIAVGSDVCLSAVQIAKNGLPLRRRKRDWILIAAGLAAPVLAFAILTGARRRHALGGTAP